MGTRAPVAVAAALLAASVAQATWEVGSIPGVPRRLHLPAVNGPADGGFRLAVGTTTGVYEYEALGLFVVDGGSADGGGNAAGVVLRTGCIGFLPSGSGGTMEFLGGCSLPEPILSAGFGAALDTTVAGTSFAVIHNSSLVSTNLYSRIEGGGWQLVAAEPYGPRMLAVAFVAGRDFGAVGSPGSGEIVLASPSGALATRVVFEPPPWKGMGLFGLKGSAAALVIDSNGGLIRTEGLEGTGPLPWTRVIGGGLAAVAVAQDGGDSWGDGFGVAVPGAGDAGFLWRAVPDPGAVAATWRRVETSFTGYAGIPTAIACTTPEFCVVLTNATDAGNVLIYRNQSAPVVGTFVPDSGQNPQDDAGVVGTLEVSDLDDDPVFVTWKSIANPSGLEPIAPVALDSEQRTVRVYPSPACSTSETAHYLATVSDGWLQHVTSKEVLVTGMGRAVPPAVPEPATIVLRAGSQPTFLFLDAGPGCVPEQWWLSDGGSSLGASVHAAGSESQVQITVPQELCGTDAGLATFLVRAQNQGGFSDAGTLDVWVEPWVAPLGDAGFSLRIESVSDRAVVLSVASDAWCPEGRLLVAELSDLSDAGVSLPALPVPGSVAIDFSAAGCANRAVSVGARLVDRGQPTPNVASVQVALPGLPAKIDGLTAAASARCEGGLGLAEGTVTATTGRGPGLCLHPAYHFEAMSGDALEFEGVADGEARIRFAASDLGELVGRRIGVRAVAGGATTDTATAVFEVGVDAALVRVRQHTDLPIGSETRGVGLRVEIENLTACPLSGVALREFLDGLRYVPGTARVGAAPAEVSGEGDLLEIVGIHLEPHGRVEVTLSARLRLLGSPAPRARAWMGAVPISEEDGIGEDALKGGCGCTPGGGPGASLTWVLWAAFALRKRRRTV